MTKKKRLTLSLSTDEIARLRLEQLRRSTVGKCPSFSDLARSMWLSKLPAIPAGFKPKDERQIEMELVNNE